ncbi:DASH complex subunit duo1 [Lecanosticta acicola]|uniref:DASH complex subunit DUO1 n=1 Tax=Lecanosticta acicola TaxID=111012 RepID=A0AAI9E7L0_9PEZI|nr:DASH complex subunit duo1 [Lecanosticta acicola]
MSKRDAPDIANLRLSDPDEDLFASPESGATTQKHTPTSNTTPSQKQQQHNGPKLSKQELQEAREAKLHAELEKVREVNRTIEGVTASLTKAQANMSTVHETVNNASTLLATWTRILSQTEHNQRLILNPNWSGATRDLEDMENDELRRQQEAEKRAMEEQRRREEAQRRAEEEERKRAVAESKRGSVTRTRSVRGTRASSLRSGAGAESSRGRGTTSSSGGTRGYGRVGSVGTSRGRGRGMG